MPSDRAYKESKEIILAKALLKLEFKALAEWIDEKYKVKTRNIFYDVINKNCPRIDIIFEYKKEMEKFIYKGNYNKRYQEEIASKFKEIMDDQVRENLPCMFFSSGKEKYKTKDIFVIFSDFETVAKMEAYEKVSKQETDELIKKIGNPDLWGISPMFSTVTFFVFTNKQLEKYWDSNELKEWENLYYNILVKYDDFSYCKREDFSLKLDSKENFDKYYKSNWYYYYK